MKHSLIIVTVAILVMILGSSGTDSDIAYSAAKEKNEPNPQQEQLVYLPMISRPSPDHWVKTFNVSSRQYGYFTSLKLDSDGDIIVSGTTQFGNDIGALVVRLSSDGKPIWQRAYNFMWSTGQPYFTEILVAQDGGLYLAGSSRIDSYDGSIALVKLDRNGVPIWQKIISRAPGFLGVSDMKEFNDGFLVRSGSSLLKVTNVGEVIWAYSYPIHWAEDVEIARDGGIILTGSGCKFDAWSRDACVIMINEDGEVIWQKALGHDGGSFKFATVTNSKNDGFLLTGYSDGHFSVFGIDKYGDISSQLFYDVAGAIRDDIATSDGGNIVVGRFWKRLSDGSRILLTGYLKLDSSGRIIWQRSFNESNQSEDEKEYEPYAVKSNADGDLFVGGYASSTWSPWDADAWLLKSDANGHVIDCPFLSNTDYQPIPELEFDIVSGPLHQLSFTVTVNDFDLQVSDVSTEISDICPGPVLGC